MVIFNSYVSLQEGMFVCKTQVQVAKQIQWFITIFPIGLP